MIGEACESSWCTCDTIAKVPTVGHLGDTSLVTPLVIVSGSFAIPREIQNELLIRLVSETNLTDFNRVRPTTCIQMAKTSYINVRPLGVSFRHFLCCQFNLCTISLRFNYVATHPQPLSTHFQQNHPFSTHYQLNRFIFDQTTHFQLQTIHFNVTNPLSPQATRFRHN